MLLFSCNYVGLWSLQIIAQEELKVGIQIAPLNMKQYTQKLLTVTVTVTCLLTLIEVSRVRTMSSPIPSHQIQINLFSRKMSL